MLLETVKCCPPDFFETDNSKAMNDFLQGETAMIISYRTPQIESSILKNNIGTKRIGFARVPGGCSILGGWSISLSATSEIKDLGFKFMDWACSESISPYLALLTGQSAIADIYNNEELMIMNPWMPTLKQITETAKPIVPPNSFMLETIPQDKISEILYSSFKDIVLGKCDIDIALEKGEETLKNIFIKYGYKQN